MHLLHHPDDCTAPTLGSPQHRHLTAKISSPPPEPPEPALATRVHSLLRYLRSRATWLREKLEQHEHRDHPDADHDRISLATLTRVRQEIVRLEIAPHAWLLDGQDAPAPRPPEAGHATPAARAEDICHGREVRA